MPAGCEGMMNSLLSNNKLLKKKRPGWAAFGLHFLRTALRCYILEPIMPRVSEVVAVEGLLVPVVPVLPLAGALV